MFTTIPLDESSALDRDPIPPWAHHWDREHSDELPELRSDADEWS